MVWSEEKGFGGMPLRLPWGYLKKRERGGESGIPVFHTGLPRDTKFIKMHESISLFTGFQQ
jgi:hypothetical protein